MTFIFGSNFYYPTACITLFFNQLYYFAFTHSRIAVHSRIKDDLLVRVRKTHNTSFRDTSYCAWASAVWINLLIIHQYLANWKYRSTQVPSILTSVVIGLISSCIQQQNSSQYSFPAAVYATLEIWGRNNSFQPKKKKNIYCCIAICYLYFWILFLFLE